MKLQIRRDLSVLVALLAMSINVTAADKVTWSYTANDAGVTITGYTDLQGATATHIEIPQTIEEKNVIAIGTSAFKNKSQLKSVVLPASLVTIGSEAFSGCSGLTSIIIPEGVTTLGSWAFAGCTSMTDYQLPLSLKSIGGRAFQSNNALKNISLPDSLKTLEDIFFRCIALESVKLPSGLTTLGGYAFQGCTSLTEILIPESVTTLGDETFYGCTSLTNAILPSYIKILPDGFFSDCSSLASIKLPSTIEHIGKHVFSGCSRLLNIELPHETKAIGQSAFKGCSRLTSIVIPGSVEILSGSMFQNCTMLSNITLNEGTTTIKAYAFEGCRGLKYIDLPQSVSKIESGAFYHANDMHEINILANTAPEIGNDAFQLPSSGNLTIHVPTEGQGYDGDAWSAYTVANDIVPGAEIVDAEWNALKTLQTSLNAKGAQVGWQFNNKSDALKGVSTLNGHVTSLDLDNIGLQGEVSAMDIVGSFPNMRSVNLRNNSISKFNISDDAKGILFNLQYQNIDATVDMNLSEIVSNSDNLIIRLPSLPFTDPMTGTAYPQGRYWKFSTMTPPNENNDFYFTAYKNNSTLHLSSGRKSIYTGNLNDVLYISYPYGGSINEGSYCKVRLNLAEGDANMDGTINIADLQRLITSAMDNVATTPISLKAADLKADGTLNVQDIVLMVDKILSVPSSTKSLSSDAMTRSLATNTITIRNGQIILSVQQPVAALDIAISNAENVAEALRSAGFIVTVSENRIIAYSLSGNVLPCGETFIGTYSDKRPIINSITLCDPDSRLISITIDGALLPTAIETPVETNTLKHQRFNANGIPVGEDYKGIVIENKQKFINK